MNNTITTTHFNFSKPKKSVYRGKVREVYNINDQYLVMVATDRLSAFDVVLPKGIPYKGQILNQIATKIHGTDIRISSRIGSLRLQIRMWLSGICANHLKWKMVIRGYLSGHAAREYALGKRTLCGVALPEGLKENDKLTGTYYYANDQSR